MAHNIHLDKLSGEHALYLKSEPAWHGLGQVVKEAVTPKEVMKLAHLDYIVDVQDVYINVDGKQTPVPNTRATYRTDTGDVFGSVTNTYTIIQNGQFIDFIYDVFKRPDMFGGTEVIIETAWALGNGAKVFVTVKVPGYIKLRSSGDDVAESYILVTTSHDGSMSFTAGLTDIRVVCNNTLNAAIPGLTNSVNFKHTSKILDRMREASTIMNLRYHRHEQQREYNDMMCRKQVTEQTIIQYLAECNLHRAQQEELIKRDYNIEKADKEIVSQRAKNRLTDMLNYIDAAPGQMETLIRGSVYWMYQGYNNYLNHGYTFKDQEDRFNSITSGTVSIKNQIAYNNALELCNKL